MTHKPNLTDKLADFLRARPNVWIFRKQLDDCIPGGGYRQEVTRCRKRGMAVECAKFDYAPLGRKVSFYRYTPPSMEFEFVHPRADIFETMGQR